MNNTIVGKGKSIVTFMIPIYSDKDLAKLATAMKYTDISGVYVPKELGSFAFGKGNLSLKEINKYLKYCTFHNNDYGDGTIEDFASDVNIDNIYESHEYITGEINLIENI